MWPRGADLVITMLLLCNSTLLRANTKLCNQTRSGFLLYIWKSAVSLQILMKMHLPLRNDGGLVRLQRLLPRTSVSEISNAPFVPTFFRSISASSRDTPKLDQSWNVYNVESQNVKRKDECACSRKMCRYRIVIYTTGTALGAFIPGLDIYKSAPQPGQTVINGEKKWSKVDRKMRY